MLSSAFDFKALQAPHNNAQPAQINQSAYNNPHFHLQMMQLHHLQQLKNQQLHFDLKQSGSPCEDNTSADWSQPIKKLQVQSGIKLPSLSPVQSGNQQIAQENTFQNGAQFIPNLNHQNHFTQLTQNGAQQSNFNPMQKQFGLPQNQMIFNNSSHIQSNSQQSPNQAPFIPSFMQNSTNQHLNFPQNILVNQSNPNFLNMIQNKLPSNISNEITNNKLKFETTILTQPPKVESEFSNIKEKIEHQESHSSPSNADISTSSDLSSKPLQQASKNQSPHSSNMVSKNTSASSETTKASFGGNTTFTASKNKKKSKANWKFEYKKTAQNQLIEETMLGEVKVESREERRLNRLQQRRQEAEEAERQKKEKGEFQESELPYYEMTEEEINEFYVAVEGVYDVSFTEEEKLKLYRLLEKFGFHKAKVFENIKKNKLYYRKYIDGLTGN